jgi:hypothetical protein
MTYEESTVYTSFLLLTDDSGMLLTSLFVECCGSRLLTARSMLVWLVSAPVT